MIDPVIFRIGSFSVKWYGVIAAFGFLIGTLIAAKLAEKRGIAKKHIYDFMLYLIPSVIIGARIFHVIGNISYYLDNLGEIIAIWNGGLAFHGGLAGAVIVGLIFVKKRNLNFYDLADIFVVPLALGLALGRIGNFINQELYGKLTNLPWGIEYDNVSGKRHPSQIYESIKNLIIFFILLILYSLKNLPKGFVFWSFICLYSFLRFFVEFIRDVPTALFSLTWAQITSIILFFLAIFVLIRLNKQRP
jgi:phosphatidylglycerol:prolipoprotein diacylglycerol transferase